MDIHKAKSPVNPQNPQNRTPEFIALGEASRSALKFILLERYANGHASLEETQRLINEFKLEDA